MVQGSPQFSPAQVLEAGRRAEQEGKHDHATQFYRHLVTHFAGSPESESARDGLERLSGAAAHVALASTGPSARLSPPPTLP
ncbi:MAG: hypothetical protein ABL982_20990, partial [Vicinamibacterales bacterium]